MEIVHACIYFTRALKLKGLNISGIKSHVIIFIESLRMFFPWIQHKETSNHRPRTKTFAVPTSIPSTCTGQPGRQLNRWHVTL
jgi:hypothetical protein